MPYVRQSKDPGIYASIVKFKQKKLYEKQIGGQGLCTIAMAFAEAAADADWHESSSSWPTGWTA